MTAPALARYRVLLDTPQGEAVVDVPSFQGPDVAGRRAHITLVAAGWGDLDEVAVLHVVALQPCDTCSGTGQVLSDASLRGVLAGTAVEQDEYGDECADCAGTGES